MSFIFGEALTGSFSYLDLHILYDRPRPSAAFALIVANDASIRIDAMRNRQGYWVRAIIRPQAGAVMEL
ncbi:hypothetical protein [Methylobacterium sp. ARG-1]|uniref:hypothetical protein n=1 Tax=Methylobacterium sp. ARG-1 TaxID=1692501 RepID=UPI0011876F06|nr:hypothetical protein [Methylobacterium sp. ARG-1]